MQIDRLPVLSDNYIFVLHDSQLKTAAAVDPAEAQPVVRHLEEIEAQLVAIFNTHHHSNHVGGNRQLMQLFPRQGTKTHPWWMVPIETSNVVCMTQVSSQSGSSGSSLTPRY